MEEVYGSTVPHSHLAYLTPFFSSALSRAVQKHLGGPEAQLSPTEHLPAVEQVERREHWASPRCLKKVK